MKTVKISKEQIFDLLEIDILHKDLRDDEEICPVCHGLGVIIRDRKFCEKESLTIKWFNNKSLHYCPNCYSGVIQKCKYCGKQFNKNYKQCDCEEFKKERERRREEKYLEKISKSEEATEDEVKNCKMFYCEETDKYYYDVDDFIDDIKELKLKIPPVLWLTHEVKISLDAYDICENACYELHEDAFESCDIGSLQKVCDKWCEKQDGTTTFYPSNKYIKVKEEWFED